MSSVLVIGSGGREHALAWRLAQSPRVKRIVVAPGNAGMSGEWERWLVSLNQGRHSFEMLADRVKEERIDLTIVGPDDPLAEGIVDVFESRGLKIMGPTAAAARIESSKSFAKEIMTAAQVPTAKYWIAHSQEEARRILRSVPWPSEGSPSVAGWVIKVDGLALGKGVRVCDSLEDALNAVQELSAIGNKWVIEEKLRGEEVSWLAFCDGETCALLDPARDYKRLLDQNQGPNTGGMGAFSPVPGLSEAMEKRVRSEVFLPTLAELKKRGTPFRGVLYAGLMVDSATERFWVLEFNARFGDPETQVLLPRLSGDFLEWCEAIAGGYLNRLPSRVPFSKDAAVCVVAASQGYPGKVETGKPIEFLNPARSSFFFAGVRVQDRQVMTAGGRVLCAFALDSTLDLAREKAYRELRDVHFEGMQFRTDIADLGKR